MAIAAALFAAAIFFAGLGRELLFVWFICLIFGVGYAIASDE